MTTASVNVTVVMQLEIDTDRPVIKLDAGVLDEIRASVERELLNAADTEAFEDFGLGHYFANVSVLKAELSPTVVPEAPPLTCPLCKSGTLQCVTDATQTRAVIGYTAKSYGNEALLSDDEDVNLLDDYRLCCNECDEEFYDDDIAAIVNGTFNTEVR